jgi:hypothetical protein
MARIKKHFVVYPDGTVYKYVAEDDDREIAKGAIQFHETLNSAKRYAKECLQRIYEQELVNIDSLSYKDFP